MFRLAYRNFGDGHEALVGNYTVSVGRRRGHPLVRAAQRHRRAGDVRPGEHLPARHDLALDGQRRMDTQRQYGARLQRVERQRSIPQIRYAGRLASDPINTLAQGEAHALRRHRQPDRHGNRWGDYSDMTVDPVDDCTFWYTQEYYATTSSFNWRTRIGNFKFPTA